METRLAETSLARGLARQPILREVLPVGPPPKQFVAVEQVAALTAFLCSDDAASITGALLPIDGGWTAQ